MDDVSDSGTSSISTFRSKMMAFWMGSLPWCVDVFSWTSETIGRPADTSQRSSTCEGHSRTRPGKTTLEEGAGHLHRGHAGPCQSHPRLNTGLRVSVNMSSPRQLSYLRKLRRSHSALLECWTKKDSRFLLREWTSKHNQHF